MTGRAVFQRTEFATAMLDFGRASIDLADYATTGLRIVAVGPSGIGKTNAGLLIAEQLAAQGWLSVLMDPEGEIAELHDTVAHTPAELQDYLTERPGSLVVVPVHDAAEFLPFGHVVMTAADQVRKPIFVMVDEGQIFSTSRRKGKQDVLGEASDLLNDMFGRGRKRALDLFISAHRFAGQLSRTVFGLKNLAFVGRQEDPAAWSSLAPMFKGSGIGYAETAALANGEFFCFSRRGIEKLMMPMAESLKKVAPAAAVVRPSRPATFSQWDRAMRELPVERLQALTGSAIALLGTIAGLSSAQLAAGTRALRDELGSRPA